MVEFEFNFFHFLVVLFVERLLFEVAVETGDKEVFEGTENIFFNVFELFV